MKRIPIIFTLTAMAASLPVGVFAEPTRELYIEGREEVFEGDPVSTRLTAYAHVQLGLARSVVLEGLEAPVTRIVRGGDGAIYVGTAGRGLFRWSGRGAEPEAVTSEGIVVSLAPYAGGVLFATSADGQVYRARGANAEPFVRIEARYVWDIATDGRRAMAVTGEPGSVVELRRGGFDTRYEADERQLRSIDLRGSRVVFGGGERGIVYELAEDGARALYDSGFEEVTAVRIGPSGRVHAGLVSVDTKATLPAFRWIGAVGQEEASDDSPFKGSELVRIDEAGRVDVLWRAQGEGLMALSVDDHGATFSTGAATTAQARLYRVDRDEDDALSLLARLEDPLAPDFFRSEDGSFVVGTGGTGRLTRLGSAPVERGEYRSTEQDFQRVGRVGRLWFDADVPPGASVALSIRTGNTSEVDPTWSAWSKGITNPAGGSVDVPSGRYAQLRLQLKPSRDGRTPTVRSMHASVVRLNDPPMVHEIFPLARGVALEALPTDSDQDKTITLSSGTLDKLRGQDEDEGRRRVRQSTRDGFQTIAWHAGDTNGDELVFGVDVRPSGRDEWTPLARGLELPFFSFDGRQFTDGRYEFRVLVSDRPSNHPSDALERSAVSAPVLIDNTAPELRTLKAEQDDAGRVRVSVEVVDETSPVVKAQVSLDGGPWLMLPAEDGIVDALQERLRVSLPPSEMGSGVGSGQLRRVSVRASDHAGNEATASVAFRAR